jgi:hypothetical protein
VLAVLPLLEVGFARSSAWAQACPCTAPDVARATAQANVIFVGKVLSAVDNGSGNMVQQNGQWRSDSSGASVITFTMQVDTSLKGTVMKLTTIATPSVCGYPLAVGQTYLVFAARNATGLWTDACKGNVAGPAVATRAAEVLRVLAPPTPTPAS